MSYKNVEVLGHLQIFEFFGHLQNQFLDNLQTMGFQHLKKKEVFDALHKKRFSVPYKKIVFHRLQEKWDWLSLAIADKGSLVQSPLSLTKNTSRVQC